MPRSKHNDTVNGVLYYYFPFGERLNRTVFSFEASTGVVSEISLPKDVPCEVNRFTSVVQVGPDLVIFMEDRDS